MSAGEALATVTTTDDCFFGLELPPYNGDVLLVATGGTYAVEALPPSQDGDARRLALDRGFLGVALGVQTGQPATANVTPISHLAIPSPESTRGKARTVTQRWPTPSRT